MKYLQWENNLDEREKTDDLNLDEFNDFLDCSSSS